MPPQTIGVIVYAAIAMCALMAVVNALRYKKRGPGAYALAAAFVALGFTLWLYSEQASMAWIDAGLILTGILLIIELALRAARLPKQGQGR